MPAADPTLAERLARLPQAVREAPCWALWDGSSPFEPATEGKALPALGDWSGVGEARPVFVPAGEWVALQLRRARDPLGGELIFWARDILQLLPAHAEVGEDPRDLLVLCRSNWRPTRKRFVSRRYGYDFGALPPDTVLSLGRPVVLGRDIRDSSNELQELFRRAASVAAQEAQHFVPPLAAILDQPSLSGFGPVRSAATGDNGRSPQSLLPNEANRLRAQWEFARGQAEVVSTPARLQLGRSNICNFHCVYCSDHRAGNTIPRSRLEGATWDHLARLIPRATFLGFHGVSEFFLDPDFFAILDTCAAARVGLMLNTNGSVCTPRYLQALTDYPAPLEITFSIDAATPATYQRLRGWDFARLQENIRRYQAAFRDRAHPLLVIYSLVLMRSNLDEVVPFLHLAKSLGPGCVSLIPLNQYEGLNWRIADPLGRPFDYVAECPGSVRQAYNRALELARRTAVELDLKLFLPPPLAEHEAQPQTASPGVGP